MYLRGTFTLNVDNFQPYTLVRYKSLHAYPDLALTENLHYIPRIYGILFLVRNNAKQKHLGCKKVRGQSEATLLTGMCDQKL